MDDKINSLEYMKTLAFNKKFPVGYNPNNIIDMQPNIREQYDEHWASNGDKPNYCTSDWFVNVVPAETTPEPYEFMRVTKDYIKEVASTMNPEPVCLQGKADEGNTLLDNLDNLWSKIDDTFGTPAEELDGVTQYVRIELLTRQIEWEGKKLVLDGAVTKINHNDCLQAHQAVLKIANKKTADKIVGSLIVKKLRKLF